MEDKYTFKGKDYTAEELLVLAKDAGLPGTVKKPETIIEKLLSIDFDTDAGSVPKENPETDVNSCENSNPSPEDEDVAEDETPTADQEPRQATLAECNRQMIETIGNERRTVKMTGPAGDITVPALQVNDYRKQGYQVVPDKPVPVKE